MGVTGIFQPSSTGWLSLFGKKGKMLGAGIRWCNKFFRERQPGEVSVLLKRKKSKGISERGKEIKGTDLLGVRCLPFHVPDGGGNL